MRKKKLLCAALAVATCVPLTLGGCAKGSGGGGKFTVTYYDSDGVTVLLEQSVSPNGKAYDWTPSKTGYEFVDWCTTTELNVPYEFARAILSDVKIYAKFGPESTKPESNRYTVTYYGEDGTTKLLEQAVEKNGKAYNWTPTKEGYKFDGWYKDHALNCN